MSNVDDSYPDFGDSELEDLGEGLPELPEETGQFDESDVLADLEPTEGEPQPGDETVPTDATDQWPVSEEGVGEPGLADLAPIEVDAKPEEPEQEEEEEEKEERPGLLARLAKTSPYVVLLGISVLAMLIAVLCLWMELRRYNYEFTPPQVNAPVEIQFAPPSTTATA